MPSLVRVTNLENGRSMKIRVNDRGPFVNGRIIDLSRRAAQLLGFEKKGTAMVRVEIMMEESQMLAMQMKNKNEPSESQYIKAVPRKEVIKGDVGDKEAPSKKLSKKTKRWFKNTCKTMQNYEHTYKTMCKPWNTCATMQKQLEYTQTHAKTMGIHASPCKNNENTCNPMQNNEHSCKVMQKL